MMPKSTKKILDVQIVVQNAIINVSEYINHKDSLWIFFYVVFRQL